MRSRSTLLLLVALAFGLGGCAGVPRIRFGKTEVVAPKDAGTPAQMNQGEEKTTVPLPAGTKVIVTEVAAIPATQDKPAVAAYKTTSFDFTQPTKFERVASSMVASTGTIDTTVAAKRIDVESKKPLLYGAMLCAGAAVVFMVLKWPSVAMLCGIAAGCFFAAWKVADVPAWVGLLFLAAAAAGFIFYKRAELDANGDGIPDRLQKS